MVEISETELIRRWVALSHEEREVYIERAMAILRERNERGELTGSITADGMKEAALLAQQLWIEDQKRAAHKK